MRGAPRRRIATLRDIWDEDNSRRRNIRSSGHGSLRAAPVVPGFGAHIGSITPGPDARPRSVYRASARPGQRMSRRTARLRVTPVHEPEIVLKKTQRSVELLIRANGRTLGPDGDDAAIDVHGDIFAVCIGSGDSAEPVYEAELLLPFVVDDQDVRQSYLADGSLRVKLIRKPSTRRRRER